MKKTILIIGIIFLLILPALTPICHGYDTNKSNIISETVIFSQPIIINKNNYVSIELIERTSNSWEKGKPTLPIITKAYTFPFGTTINSVNVTFSENIEKELLKPIIPSPDLHIFSTLSKSINKKSEKEINYSDIDIYPEDKYSYRVGAGLQNEERVIQLVVSINPVQYLPGKNLLLYSEKATIDILYTLPANPVVFPDVYDFMIITPSQFENALQPLVDHKNNLDPPVRTNLVTLDDVPEGVGVDRQEDIKYFIKDAVENWGIIYVLLVGSGVEGEELFPVRNSWIDDIPEEEYFPCDLYFADVFNATMEFPDWDADEDGKYGECPDDLPEMDVLPDVYLGKLPCNNVEEVNTVVNKIINYKMHNKMTEKILQIAGDTTPGNEVYEGEYLNEKVLEKLPGYNSICLWGSNGKLSKGNIGKGFRSCVDFVDIPGHGNPICWATFAPNDHTIMLPSKTIISPYDGFFNFDIDLYSFNNVIKLPVVVFTACSNNKYTESPDCIGWKMLSKKDGGGIATFGESGIAGGLAGYGADSRFAGWFEVKVFEELYGTKVLGQVWANCIIQYYITFELLLNCGDYKMMLEFSMFGDPTLVMEDGDNPKNIPVDKSISGSLLLRFLERYPLLNLLFQRLTKM